MIATDQLLDVFVGLADTLVDDFDLIDFLEALSTQAAAIGEATTAGIVLVDARGALQFMAATSEDARSMELFQLQSAEGPCQDCFRTGGAVIATDLSEMADRWPRFVPAALERDVQSVHAFPMRLRNQVIGGLNIFSDHKRALSENEQRVVQSLADIATIGILQERAINAAEVLTVQLEGALNSRVVIEQAKGVIAQSLGLGVQPAFVKMRNHARAGNLRLTDLAADVVNGVVQPRDLD